MGRPVKQCSHQKVEESAAFSLRGDRRMSPLLHRACPRASDTAWGYAEDERTYPTREGQYQTVWFLGSGFWGQPGLWGQRATSATSDRNIRLSGLLGLVSSVSLSFCGGEVKSPPWSLRFTPSNIGSFAK